MSFSGAITKPTLFSVLQSILGGPWAATAMFPSGNKTTEQAAVRPLHWHFLKDFTLGRDGRGLEA